MPVHHYIVKAMCRQHNEAFSNCQAAERRIRYARLPALHFWCFVFFSSFFPLSGSVGNLVLIFTHCECSCCSFLEMISLLDNIDSSSVKSAGIKGQKEQCFFPPPISTGRLPSRAE